MHLGPSLRGAVSIAHFLWCSPAGRILFFRDCFGLVESGIERWHARRPGDVGEILTTGPTIVVFVGRGDAGCTLCFGRVHSETRERIGKLTVLSLREEIDALAGAIALAKNTDCAV